MKFVLKCKELVCTGLTRICFGGFIGVAEQIEGGGNEHNFVLIKIMHRTTGT